MSFALHNCIIYTGSTIEQGKAVLIKNDRIIGIVSGSEIPSDYELLDLQGHKVAPSFLDLQIYGGGGSMFNTDTSAETIFNTYTEHRRSGTTGLQITLSSMSFEKMLEAIDVAKSYQQSGRKGLLGLHLEGPYFSMEKRGAHLSQYIRKATIAEVEAIIERSQGLQTYLTFAPEQMDDDCFALLANSHIHLSAGHSSATYRQAKRAFDKGIKRVTHLFNAMTAFQSREPGLVGATYDSDASASIIVDGIHCDFASVRISKKIMAERLFLITDAVTQDPRGAYAFHFAGDRYTDANGVLSGSALTMIQAVQNCVEQVGIPLDEALRMASTYPAQVIGIDNYLGLLAADYQADMLIFNNNFDVTGIVERGEVELF